LQLCIIAIVNMIRKKIKKLLWRHILLVGFYNLHFLTYAMILFSCPKFILMKWMGIYEEEKQVLVDDEIKRLVGKSIVRTNDFPSLCRKKAKSSLNNKLEEHPVPQAWRKTTTNNRLMKIIVGPMKRWLITT